MKWSKLKRIAEDLLAESLKGRVQYHITRYGPGVSSMMNRGWVTFDQQEILRCSTIKSIRVSYQLARRWYAHDEQTLAQLQQQGCFTCQDFVNALEEYVMLQTSEALRSESPIVRAIVMFDRRLGKRRLQKVILGTDEHLLVRKFHTIRCEVEGLPQSTSST